MSRYKLSIRLAGACLTLAIALGFMSSMRPPSGATSSYSGTGGDLSNRIALAAARDDDGPKAHDDFDSTYQGVPVQTEVTANDEIDNFNLTLKVHNHPEHGSAVPLDKQIITYTPEPNFTGVDSYRYQICSNKGGDDDDDDDDDDHDDDDDDRCSEADVVITVHVAEDAPDQSTPKVTWLSPVGDEQVYYANGEMVVLEVHASDDQGIERVEFHRWDVPTQGYIALATLTTAPYRFELDTRTLNLGWNQINARAYDTAGNASDVGHIWVLKIIQIFLPLAAR